MSTTIEYDFPPPRITSPPPDDGGGGGGSGVPAVIISIVILGIIFVVSIVCAKKMKKRIVSEIQSAVAPSLPTSHVIHPWEADTPTMEKFFIELAQERPVRFTAPQLYTFTQNYTTVLGAGGFGKVYKGEFPNGMKIAVKVLNRGPNRSIEDQFMAEVGTIGRTHHIC